MVSVVRPMEDAQGVTAGTRTECPVLIAISFRFLNTVGRVSGLGLNRVFWLFLEF